MAMTMHARIPLAIERLDASCMALARSGIALVCVAFACCVPLLAWADDAPVMPEVPTPKNANAQWIATDMKFNGAPIRMRSVDVAMNAEDTLAFYRDYFKRHAKQAGRYAQNKTGNGVLLGAEVEASYVTVELRKVAPNRTHALVSAMDHAKLVKPETLARDLPKPAGSAVLQVLESDDGFKTNKTVVLNNRQSPEFNDLYYREQLIAQGWTRLRDDTLKPGEYRQLTMRKGARETQFHFIRDGDLTTVIASTIDGAP